MSSDSVLHSVIAEAGYDANSIIAKANSPEIKQDLRARTKEAKDTGICGVPSYRVFRRRIGHGDQDWRRAGDIIWGQDETVVVEDLISGWDGQSGVFEAGGDERPRKGSARL
jgi:2-hydroxychromene-2-carboxylate isomerase